MLPSNIELLRHILDETTFILNAVKGKCDEQIVKDAVLSRAIIRSLEIIDEAITKANSDFKTLHSHVEWKKMSGIKNRIG